MSPTRHDQRSGLSKRACPAERLREIPTRSVEDVKHLDHLLEHCLPSFGGAYLRRTWQLLDEAVGQSLPLTLAVAGPVTLSGQIHTWLGPLLDTGWFMLVSTTDAVCYHDGHRALNAAKDHPIHEVDIFGDDGLLRDEGTIRVTDIGFDEEVLFEQDRYLRACLRQREFQRKMSGPEFRHLLGLRYAAQERQNGVREGLLALCARKAIPIFVGAPADGSIFLNSMALWALERVGGRKHRFELDLHLEVFESCAYHYWGLRESESRALGTLILGGGVPKNFNLQPEPALSQVLGLPHIAGYLYDIQLTTAPITDGSLSSCPPGEAVTWGKVDKDSYKRTTESMQVDYSIVMPILVKALLDKRARMERLELELGLAELTRRHPEAKGYLRPRGGYRLYERRAELMETLLADVKKRAKAMEKLNAYPLAPVNEIRLSAGRLAQGRRPRKGPSRST